MLRTYFQSDASRLYQAEVFWSSRSHSFATVGLGSAEDQHGGVDWAVKKTDSSTGYYLT